MLPRQEGPISDGAVRRAVKHDTSGDRRAMPHTRLLVNTAGVEPVRLEFQILSLNAGRRQRCVPPIVCPTLSRVWKLSCSPCSTWPSRPQSSVCRPGGVRGVKPIPS